MDTRTRMADVDSAVIKSEPTEIGTSSIISAQPDAVVKSETERVDDSVKTKTEENEEQEDSSAKASAGDADPKEASDTENSQAEADLCPREAGFTSEKFKIEITGLPRRFGFKV